METLIWLLGTQRKKLDFIRLIMTGDFLVVKWCLKLMNARCQECSQGIKLHQNYNIRYGKLYKLLIIVKPSSLLMQMIMWYYVWYDINKICIFTFNNPITFWLNLSFYILLSFQMSVELYCRFTWRQKSL